MDAVIVDLKDFTVRTPDQVYRVFFKLYNSAKVKTELWQLFGEWASARDQGPKHVQDAEVALLFDQLIALVEALENISNRNAVADSCMICGQATGNRGGEVPIELV